MVISKDSLEYVTRTTIYHNPYNKYTDYNIPSPQTSMNYGT